MSDKLISADKLARNFQGKTWYSADEVLDAISDAQTVEAEPRVMTLEEVQTAEDCCEPVFLEMDKYLSTPDVFSWAMIKHIEPLNDKRIYVLDRPGFSSALYSEWYGVYWRCWTAKPTDEQREAVKWDV